MEDHLVNYALGIDIGGTNTKVARVSSEGHADVVSFPTGSDTARLITQICESQKRLDSKHGGGAGVAVAGFLNPARDRLSYNPNLAWLVGFPLRDALAEALGMSILLEVDSNAACLGEYRFGAGRCSKRFLCLAAGTGLGAGMIIEGELLRFAGECIGDAGHVVVDPSGPLCPCGGRGCAEAMVSESAIVAAAESADTLRGVIAAAQRGDAPSLAALEQAGHHLGIAMASLAQIFTPDCIALAGGLAEGGQLVMGIAETSFRERVNLEARRGVAIVKAELGWQATVIGAAAPLLLK
jgi:glucokinase